MQPPFAKSCHRSAVIFGATALALLSACGSSTNPNTPPANLLFVNASPDAPALSFFIDQQSAVSFVTYPNTSGAYGQLSAGTHEFTGTIAGSDLVVFDFNSTLNPSAFYTIWATDSVADIAPLILLDDFSPVTASQAGIRFVHLSPNTGPVDAVLGDGGPLIGLGVSFEGTSTFFGADPGSYQVIVNPHNGSTTLATLNVTLQAGSFYTVWLGGYTANSSFPLTLYQISYSPTAARADMLHRAVHTGATLAR